MGREVVLAGVSVASVCRKLSMSRQNYYARRRQRERKESQQELALEWVRKERREQPRLGGRKLRYLLKEKIESAGLRLGRDRFFDLLRGAGMLVARLPREWVQTTCSRHGERVYPNLVKALEEVKEPHHVLVSDLTYIRTNEGFLFLSLVTDKGSRKIVGHHCADGLQASGCIRALEGALRGLPKEARPIHHSDRGTQYCSKEYVGRLKERGLPVSMTEKNHCAENALAERMNGILKGEYGLGACFPTRALARESVEEAIRLYNERRPHTSLDYRTPHEAHSLVA